MTHLDYLRAVTKRQQRRQREQIMVACDADRPDVDRKTVTLADALRVAPW